MYVMSVFFKGYWTSKTVGLNKLLVATEVVAEEYNNIICTPTQTAVVWSLSAGCSCRSTWT